MDDILELLNMPSWSDIGGLRNQLDENSPSIIAPCPATTLNPTSTSKSEQGEQQFPNDEVLQRQNFAPGNMLRQSMQMHLGGAEGLTNNLLPSPAFDWRHQPYIGELQSLISTTNPAHFYATSNRYRSGGSGNINRDATRGAATPQMRPPMHTMQAPSRVYRNGPPPPINSGGAPRPRVRARRGQATDPHSIAERQRRERIAERMKSLQLLVPNANKTDKAIMLDEIIEYVKFLQLQAKILDISNQHGTVPSLLPTSEFNNTLGQSNGTTTEALVNMERQVARLMDEDMDAALQFLQSKGFCLMPIPMATALSAATNGIHQPMDKLEACSTIVTTSSHVVAQSSPAQT